MPDLKQTFVWVTVPGGVEGNLLKFSVILYPRLFVLESGQPAATTVPLEQFADMLQWPGLSNGVRFEVQFGNTKAVRPRRISRQPDQPSWHLLFTRETPVECYDQPRTEPESTLAYPAAAMHRFLKDQYKLAGQGSPWAPPLAETLVQNFTPVAPAIFAEKQKSPLLREVYDTFRGGEAPMNYVDDRNYPPGPARDWLLAKLFFRPLRVTRFDDSTAAMEYVEPQEPGPGTSTAPEFHKMIAMLQFHAELARLYGLIVDFEVEKPKDMPLESFVKVTASWNGPGKVPTVNASPITHYTADFLPRPRPHNPEDIVGNMINLATPRYHVVQTELDGGVVALQKMVERLPSKVGERLSLPQLATGGLSLVRESAAQRHVEQRKLFNSNYAVRVGDPGKLEVWAEDLLLGYRLDVWSDRAGRWHSLHQRNTTYKFLRSKPTYMEFVNEGWVNPAFGVLDDGLVSESLMSPYLARWNGWSLSAPREPSADVDVDENMLFGVRYAVRPGTLPWLRFGTTYRLRMRTLNLAGLGQPFDPGTDPGPLATQPLVYRRFEPVGVPFVLLRQPLTTGESVPRLVIRDTEPAVEAERHIAPPQTTVELCETHGLFDTPTGMDPAKVENAEDRQDVTVPGEHPGTELPVEYLADYLARGAALTGVPGAPGPVHVDFGTTWPQRRAFRLKLRNGSGAPMWDAGARELTVSLPPAETARVRLSSFFQQGDLNSMALWQWLQEGLSGDDLAQMEQGILDGRHWALTPGRELLLVHAVQQPMASPDFTRVGALRGEGETSATFSGVIGLHGKSTGKVTVRVQWVEPVDEPETEAPGWVGGRGHAFEARVANPGADTLNVESRYDFRDTKYRRVQLTATGTTRFTDFFPKGATLEREGMPIEVDVPNTARPAAPRIQYVVPTFGWEQPAASGSSVTRIRWGGGLRVYLDRPWYSTGEGEMLAVVLYDEKSTGFFRRPEPPEGVKPWVTLWGADPLHRSGDTHPYPKLEHFKSAQVTQTGLRLAEAGDAPILVAGHPVKFDEQQKRWYCDIELDAGPAYFPFVRLALARFQPHSVSGAHLSPVVAADIAQIAPNRTATVTRNGDQVQVVVAGPTYTAGRAGPAVVRVTLEEATSRGGILAWAPAGAVATLRRDGDIWLGSLTRPAGAVRMRVVVREYERLLSDSGVAERLVYADAIEL